MSNRDLTYLLASLVLIALFAATMILEAGVKIMEHFQ